MLSDDEAVRLAVHLETLESEIALGGAGVGAAVPLQMVPKDVPVEVVVAFLRLMHHLPVFVGQVE